MTPKENKYKIKDAAKDLNLSAAEVVDMVKELTGAEKKPAGSVTESELNIVLEHISQSNQVKNFDAYFAAGAKKKEEPKAEAKPEKKAEKKTDKAEKPEKKAEPKAEVKAEKKPEPKAEAKPEKKPSDKPQNSERKPFDKQG